MTSEETMEQRAWDFLVTQGWVGAAYEPVSKVMAAFAREECVRVRVERDEKMLNAIVRARAEGEKAGREQALFERAGDGA